MVRSELEFEDHHEARVKDKKERDDERNHDRDRNREREKVRDREKERNKEKEKARDRDREKERARDREKDKLRDKERDRDRDRERERDRERDRDEREREWDDKERDWSRDRERDREEKEERERDRERDRDRKERDRERRESSKDRDFDAKHKDKDKEKDEKKKDRSKGRSKEADNRRDADLVKERKKDKDKRDRDTDKEKEKERDREKEKETDRDREKDRDRDKERDREKEKEKEKEFEKERERHKERDRDNRHGKEGQQERQKEQETTLDLDVELVLKDVEKRAAQEGKKGKSDSASEISTWVNKSRNLEEQKKIEERIKAARMARLLSEQDSGEDSEDEVEPAYSGKDLAGLKILHGIEGGAVVLTLKDKGILDKDDLNNEADELENLEISQQLSRDKAYKDAKKKPGIYEDKFQNDISVVRTILPQYDDEMEDGLTLDETGGINEEGRKRLEELRKKLQGVEQKAHESLAGSLKVNSDFYSQDEMLQFIKPKKKKKLRKKEVLDLDAMEAEAKAEGLGDADLGSRSSGAKQAQKVEKEKAAEESRKSAYLNAYTKAVDASQKLRVGSVTDRGSDDVAAFGGEEDDELERSLQRARQAALKKQAENGVNSSGPQAVASALQQSSEMKIEIAHADDAGDRDKTAVVFTETEEFCRNIQLDEVLLRRPGAKDVFAEDDEPMEEEKPNGLDGGWMEVNGDNKAHKIVEKQAEEDPSGEEVVTEVAVGKGLSGALQLLKERGTLKETVEWGGRNMDKKKSKLVGIVDQEEKFKNREILLERVDEFGRVMTPKEAFRKLSHKFHGKGPGKMKQEKRMKQYEEEMKLKQMTSGDTPLLSMEKMREAQAKLHTPYLVISGHIQPGQTSDPGSGFATMDKESIGSLTPMLGDQKVEYFLGIKRKPEGGSMKPPLPKKPKAEK